MDIRPLTSADKFALHRAFQAGFSDYSINILSDSEAFFARLERIGFDPALSAGVFEDGEIIAFVFHGIGVFEGQKTAYNGGTAVRPEARRKGYIREIYRFLWPELHKAGIKNCLLEVISDNLPAVSLYLSMGFLKSRLLISYRIETCTLRESGPAGLKILQRKAEAEILPHAFGSDPVSWQNNPKSVLRCPAGETIFTAFRSDRAVGAISLSLETGKVSALAVRPDFRRTGIAAELLCEAARKSPAESLTFINTDSRATGFRTFLNRMGAKEILQQIEMHKPV